MEENWLVDPLRQPTLPWFEMVSQDDFLPNVSKKNIESLINM
jgi:hypothetical protein